VPTGDGDQSLNEDAFAGVLDMFHLTLFVEEADELPFGIGNLHRDFCVILEQLGFDEAISSSKPTPLRAEIATAFGNSLTASRANCGSGSSSILLRAMMVGM